MGDEEEAELDPAYEVIHQGAVKSLQDIFDISAKAAAHLDGTREVLVTIEGKDVPYERRTNNEILIRRARDFLSSVPATNDTPDSARELINDLDDSTVIEIYRQTSRFVIGQIFIAQSENR